jgi:hypothetical protein
MPLIVHRPAVTDYQWTLHPPTLSPTLIVISTTSSQVSFNPISRVKIANTPAELTKSIYPRSSNARIYIALREVTATLIPGHPRSPLKLRQYRAVVVRDIIGDHSTDYAVEQDYCLGPVVARTRSEALKGLLGLLEREAEKRMGEIEDRMEKEKEKKKKKTRWGKEKSEEGMEK